MPPPPAPTAAATTARVEGAWTVSAGALDGTGSYGSAVLHLECQWLRAAADGACTCAATIDRAGRRTSVPLAAKAAAHAERRGRWTHLHIDTADGTALLRASFELGRLVYCTSTVPQAARLPGGTYDPPTGILEMYEVPGDSALGG